MSTRSTEMIIFLPGKSAAEAIVRPFTWTPREKPKGARELIDWDEGPGYDLLRSTIEPILAEHNGRAGSLEHVSVLIEKPGGWFQPADMFVDDVGALEPRLPRNEEATAIYRTNWLRQRPATDPESMPAIHGCAIVFATRVWF